MTDRNNQVERDDSFVNRLIAAQFPKWANLPLKKVTSYGTDHTLYRLGKDMVLRFPRVQWADTQVIKEHRFLPKLAPNLPLAIPLPLALGTPAEGYPWHWGIYKWIKGQDATRESLADPKREALRLAQFINALHQISPEGGPPPGPHNVYRGVPLIMRDEEVRTALFHLKNTSIDIKAANTAWEKAIKTHVWTGQPVWIHGDLHAGNLLIDSGQLRAVIDFGALSVGDPATDLMVAWNLFSFETRKDFRKALDIDEATWDRGRGWALSFGLIALSRYEHSNPVLTAISKRLIREVLSDYV